MNCPLLQQAIDASGGQELWSRVRRLRVDIAIGGPIWARKGWPAEQVFDQILAVEPRRQHIVFTPFTRPDRYMVFDAATDTVTMHTDDGDLDSTLSPARASFTGMLRYSDWDALHLGYFLGYACWNYFTAPFLFAYAGVRTEERGPWHEAGQTWQQLAVSFPPTVVTHSPEQVFYFDHAGLQRRMDYVAEVNGSALVAHYSSRYREFYGLQVATRRRVFRRNPDNSVNLNVRDEVLAVSLHGVR
ncbi:MULTISPECIES: hypothetical protein [unclassified Mycolicibacterium]|uniref:hypothetical protein n=1 Tax=unclassified Mycolicibacterium TaxID=2636767 RepID=UPI002EDA7305